MDSTCFHVLEGQVAYGEIGLDGKLGYHDDEVFLPSLYGDWNSISAHGPSELKVKFENPVEICGILDGSSYRLDRENPVEYHIGPWRLGQCIGPWDETRSVVLAPGEYTLKIDVGKNAEHCHSLWCIREVNRELANEDNTIILTVDTFGAKSSYSKMFRETAEKNGIPVIFLDEGKPWKGFYQHKIERMIPRLEQFRGEGKRFGFILDSRDVVFIDPFRFMLAKFNAINEGKMIFNTDGLGALYPCGQEWIKSEYRKAVGHFQGFLNAGVLAGSIDVLLEIMSRCTELRADLMEKRPREGIMQRLYDTHGSWSHNDDQYLYQLCHMYYPELFAPDIEKRLCVHLKDMPVRDWRNYYDFRDGRSLGSSSILHFPDKAGHAYWEEWVRCGGRFPDIETDLFTIHYRSLGYGNITLDRNLGYEGKVVAVGGVNETDRTISAHANSIIELSVWKNFSIAGALNSTAIRKNGSDSGAEFEINGRSIGSLDKAGEMTHFVDMPPGEHTLTIQSTGSSESCHSFWVVREKKSLATSLESETSIITCVRNQNDSLRPSLENWLKFDVRQVVIVDWRDDSCEKAGSVLDEFNDPRIVLLETQFEYRFLVAYALNLALSRSTSSYVLKLDTGHMIHDDFFNLHSLGDREFLFTPDEKQSWMTYAPKALFDEVGGYNESLTYLGNEETDLHNRLKQNKIIAKTVLENSIEYVVNENASSTLRRWNAAAVLENTENAEQLVASLRDMNAFMSNVCPWTRESKKTKWRALSLSENRFQVVRDKTGVHDE